jgi:pimeloyl-ACP methyl ester carboxylesterase
MPSGAPVPPILPPQGGYLFLDRAKFRASFAADVDAEKAAFMADSQVPWGVEALSGKISERAWKAKPSWYLIATDDKMIPPDAQRSMAKRAGSTVVEVKGSHAICVSQPGLSQPLSNKRKPADCRSIPSVFVTGQGLPEHGGSTAWVLKENDHQW